MSSVAIEHEKRDKKHRRRRLEEDSYDPWDEIFSGYLLEEESYEDDYVEEEDNSDLDWWYGADDYDDFEFERDRRRFEPFELDSYAVG
jgi:hypothetical protein